MANHVKEIDRGWNRIKKEIEKSKKAYVKIGIFQSAPSSEDGVTQAEKAFWNEFGTKNIPERSFIRSNFDEQVNKYFKNVRDQFLKIYDGTSTVSTSLEKLGQKVQSDIRKKIKNVKTPPNSLATIKAKGSSNPLIDKSDMLKSVDYEVVK